ncbi:MIP/aquaporin family protein [Mariniflexile sp. AS56]|uniref:MIP/aquaporin family protein n=1 Tax=Mariniflexile sp. AS56 TaxID=3063957 RepID=UPI0026ECE7A2|nr:MIP/aquaporin family protein [Mariniflexile sp. AS56]MDO7173056.1 MIP/aquaporin family protein [Mariniflexile sp. AS56]
MANIKEYLGEFAGTFILVLFGCSSVASAVILGAFNSLLEVAIIWGIGVAIAIFTVRNMCPAHLNPAVSLAMCFAQKLKFKKLPFYILSQSFGAFMAAALIYFIFNDSIIIYETTHAIVRGSADSYRSAMMFGEYFPNPSFEGLLHTSPLKAGFMEGLGTFILVLVIFRLIERQEQIDNTTPILIGLTVTLLICLIAPFTQGGFNPARDFAPRLVAYFGGWKMAAFPSYPYSFFTVYILAPFIGGLLATLMNKIINNIKA